jgi:hypothetical protein
MSATKSKCLVFVGPTLVDANIDVASRRGVQFVPPVKRGDIDNLISKRSPGVIAIVDGLFHQCLSVGHAEIRTAVELGWQVWGLSSMGAIRAYEMRHMGVRGFGRVHELFDQFEDFRDDEVALIHEAGPSYRPLSEPLVHIRFWLKELVDREVLTKRHEKRLLDQLMSLWYADRTLTAVRRMVTELIPKKSDEVRHSMNNFDRYRVKSHDLTDFLRSRPWIPNVGC